MLTLLHRVSIGSARSVVAVLAILSILSVPAVLFAQQRELLYPAELRGELKTVARRVQNLKKGKVPAAELRRDNRYFLRIAPRDYVLNDRGEPLESAVLGSKPFVFFTTPEGVYGKSLLEIYLDIGYVAADIIRFQRDMEMVAIIFRYPEHIKACGVRDGRLPEDWKKHVIVPTWDNILVLFTNLSAEATIDPDRRGEFAPSETFFRSEAEKSFVLSFPDDGKQRVKTVDYATLKAAGGADWAYRSLLENKLSVFEHFRGNGWTLNEIEDPNALKPESGILEFVGPNMKLRELPEIAVVDLGKLIVRDSYQQAANVPRE